MKRRQTGDDAYIARALAIPEVRTYVLAIGMLADAPAEVRTQVRAFLGTTPTTPARRKRRAPKLTPAQEAKRRRNLQAHFKKLRAEREAKAVTNG